MKSNREQVTRTPPALRGKFSAAFSQFEAKSARARSSSPQTAKQKAAKDQYTPSHKNLKQSVPQVEKVVMSEQVRTVSSQPKSRPPLTREDMVTRPDEKEEDKSRKHVEKSRSLEVAVPRASPSGSKVLERMAKFGKSVDSTRSSSPGHSRDKPDRMTVTTKNSATDKFERFTHSAKEDMTSSRQSTNQPQFDVDIQLRNAARKSAPDVTEERYTLWDTQIPVSNNKEKVIPLN